MQKIICGEIGGLKKENFISIYISIRYKSVVSPRRITKHKINPLIISRYQGIFILIFFTYTYSTSIERHGNSIIKVVPIPSWESTNIRPFIFSTISLQIGKPRPAP